ncbi:hypothetical protein CCR96_18150 [Halochromatium roseum]|nr:hypothetical protein [Halochromatium roseum]
MSKPRGYGRSDDQGHLMPIGPEIEYHGIRRSYFGSVYDLMSRIYHNNKPVWELLTDGGHLFPPPLPTPTAA